MSQLVKAYFLNIPKGKYLLSLKATVNDMVLWRSLPLGALEGSPGIWPTLCRGAVFPGSTQTFWPAPGLSSLCQSQHPGEPGSPLEGKHKTGATEYREWNVERTKNRNNSRSTSVSSMVDGREGWFPAAAILECSFLPAGQMRWGCPKLYNVGNYECQHTCDCSISTSVKRLHLRSSVRLPASFQSNSKVMDGF